MVCSGIPIVPGYVWVLNVVIRASTRPCDKVEPEDLDLTGFTHLNFAFAFFHPTTFQMTDMDANAGRLYNRFTELKASKPSLKTWISVGGWSFNDETNIPNTRMAFSDMASTAENRAKFISSLVHFMSAYGFDGMDLDWEVSSASLVSGITMAKKHQVPRSR